MYAYLHQYIITQYAHMWTILAIVSYKQLKNSGGFKGFKPICCRCNAPTGFKPNKLRQKATQLGAMNKTYVLEVQDIGNS